MIKTVLAFAVDYDYVLQVRQLRLELGCHKFMVETAEQLGHDENAGLAKREHVAKFTRTKVRYQWIDNCTQAPTGQGGHRKFPPVRQLDGDDIAAAHPEFMQGRSSARHPIAQLKIAQAQSPHVNPVGNEGRFVRKSVRRCYEQIVECLLAPVVRRLNQLHYSILRATTNGHKVELGRDT